METQNQLPITSYQSAIANGRISMTAAESKKRKVLIVSFSFPPTNNIAAVRIGKSAKYLPRFGWEPIVLTADTAKGYPQGLPVEINEANIIRMPYFALQDFIQYKLVGSKNLPPQTQASAGGKVAWNKRMLGAIRLTRPVYTLPLVSILVFDPIGWYPYAVRKGLLPYH